MTEIRTYMADKSGESHTQTDRRTRSLREAGIDYQIVRDGKDSRYRLTGWRRDGPGKGVARISAKIRAQVLAPGRCAMCGKTPLADHVKLVVDHKVPQEWGGGDELENLQPLCEECNGGKKAWFATYDSHADQIRAAINHDEVHRRIGELLKAFQGEWVFTELIGIVASAQSFQEDYQKRLRELRTLGWLIPHQKRYTEGARVRTYYRCNHWEPWPETNAIITEIRAREKANREAKKNAAASS
jgi:5-methylcytosine-specific restriction endonuclease McrA